MDNSTIWIFIGIFIAVDICILVFVLSRQKRGFSQSDRQRFQEHWRNIQAAHDFRHAIMDADKLLDQMLSRWGYSGQLGDKLKRADKVFTNINGLWQAHKLRNRLAHELDFNVSADEARKALKQFEAAYRDLGLFK